MAMMPTSPLPNASTAASQQVGIEAPRSSGIAAGLEGAFLVASLATIVATFAQFFARRQPLESLYSGRLAFLFGGLIVGAIAGGAALWNLRRRAPSAASTVLRQAFTCVVGAAILCAIAVQPYRRLAGVALLGFAASGFSFLRLLSPVLERRVPRRLRVAVAFVAFQVCVVAVAGEMALRRFAILEPSPLFARSGSGAQQAVLQSRFPPGRVRFGFRCNSLGYYDDEWTSKSPGKPRVALIGDSFVAGIVPHYFHFATVCERESGAELCAVGVPGVGPYEYLYLLESDGLALDPDVVVISLFVGNDFIEAEGRYAPTSFGRDWLDSENLLVRQVPRRLRIVMAEAKKLGHAAGAVAGENATGVKVTNDPAQLVKEFPWLDDPTLEVAVTTEQRYLDLEINRAFLACRLDAAPPTPVFAALRAIRKLCGSRPMMVLVLPDEFQVEDELWSAIMTSMKRMGSPALDRERPQKLLAPFFEEEGIPYLDVRPLLRAAPPLADGKRHVYAMRDSHVNRRGNEIVGKALAEFLRPRLAELRSR